MALPTVDNVSRPLAFGYGARLDDLYLRLDVDPKNPLDVVSAPLQPPVVNTTAEAEDFSNDFGQMFSRAQFAGGAGLAYAHLGSTSRSAFSARASSLDDSRFWDSEGILAIPPAPGETAKITLLPPTVVVEASVNAGLQVGFDGTTLVMLDGSNARTTTDFTGPTPTFATITPWNVGGDSAAPVLDVTVIGTTLYFACGANGIHSRAVDGTLASVGTDAAVRVWGVKRQLLASTGVSLDSVPVATGVHTPLVVLPAGETWRDVCDAGAAILAAGSDGAIYALAFTSSGAAGGALELKAQTPMNVGETPTAVCFDGSAVFFTTSEPTATGAIGRWYRADLASDFTLADAVLLRQWGDPTSTIDCAPQAVRATRDAVLVGVQETDGRCFLWRYDRATTGVARHLGLGTGGPVVDLEAVAGRLFATVAGAGLRREQVGEYEPSGWLIGPLADFFTASPKAWAGAILDCDAVTDGARVRLLYTADPEAITDQSSSVWAEAKNITSGNDPSETPIVNLESRYLAGQVRLEATSDGSGTPAVRSFSFRAYPGAGDLEVTMSVVCGDIVERRGRRPQRVAGLGDEVYGALRGREGTYAELELLRAPTELLRGVVEQVGVRVQAISGTGAALDVAAVKFRGRRVSLAGPAASTTAGGIGQMGLMQMGVPA